MEITKVKKYTYFIGIDVSRNKLDHAVFRGRDMLFHRETGNDPESIMAFIMELKQLPGFVMTRAVFCMEQTGIYTNHLLGRLKTVKANVVIDGPLQIRNSLGQIRGKTDKLDAKRIAEYAYKNREHLRLWIPKRPVILQLANLSALRNRLVILEGSIAIPLKEEGDFNKKGTVKMSKQLSSRTQKAIKADILDVEKTIARLIAADQRLARLSEIMNSVVGIGPVITTQIIVCTNEFRDIKDPKKFACYSGVAPFMQVSGTMKGKTRVSQFANKRMKALLHLAAIQAMRNIPELRAYYERKTVQEGKHKMSVINALRYKMILRIFACVNQDRLYEKEYVRKQQPEALLTAPEITELADSIMADALSNGIEE
ncbi:transposase [Mucilaginibacter gracilis]|uniref:Transposase n=1 Tax=Mucilaginibacter gracilis TaxID=423350 RepID=A0A495J4L6_9SPHI|nr:transposase [Mucilaginibacter gracilis]RKR83328.1 transposase [Mucilaginibacter gracilis]